jgi:hypothetical protein
MHRRSARLLLAAALTVGLSVPAAAAKPFEHERFHEQFSEVIEGFCNGLTVRHDVDVRGSVRANARGRDRLVYFAEHLHGLESFTNLANRKTFTLRFDFQVKDQRVTDNQDGTLTILVKTPGRQTVIGPDGRKLFLDAGATWFEVLVDHAGTPTDPSDDEFLEFLGIVKAAGRQDTAGRDFCDDIREFIG